MPPPRKRLSQWKVTDNPRAKRIIAWLRRTPIPDFVLGLDDDQDEPVKAAVKTPTGKVRWTDVTNAVIHCTKLKATDATGALLRVLELDDDQDALNQTVFEQKREAHDVRDMALPGREPIISVDVPLLVRSIADAMKEVAQSASERQAEAYTAGMAAMTNVVNLCMQMLQRVDERLEDREDEREELLQAQRAEAAQQLPGQPSTRDMLLQAALQKALGGEGAPGDGSNGVDPSKVQLLTQLFKQYAGRAAPPADEGSQ